VGLAPGTRFGVYEIVSPLGSGGMGEVYRARDTSLSRDVAIKVLPEIFAADPARLERFDREAKILASLNHPNIAHIHAIETTGSSRALILELVEGPTLADRLAAGAVPLQEALPIARQITEALEAAHEQGIVHRDLKPANIKLRPDGTVKVLDFGLAKALDGTPEGGRFARGDVSQSPTLTSPAVTNAGVILGTAAYMSPEQAKGSVVDKRADIWAFGAVLFEMIAGRAPFNADNTTELLGAVVLKEPEWSGLPAATPPRIRELLARCLEKDPTRRLRDIADARYELSHIAAPVANAAHARSRSIVRHPALWFAIGAALAAIGVWLGLRAPAPPAQPPRHFTVTRLTPLVFDAYQTLTLSPDGHALAFRGHSGDGVDRLFVRDWRALDLTTVAGTEGARLPFFSPDGEWLAFFAGGFLKKVRVASGGGAQNIVPARVPLGGTWLDDGSIVFVGDANIGVQKVSSSGGTPETLLAADVKSGINTPSAPFALPGSRFVALSLRRGNRFDIAVLSLRDHRVEVIAEDGYAPIWANGHVVFNQGTALLAVPVDLERGTKTGAAFPVLSGLGTPLTYMSRLYAAAPDGTLVYVPPAAPSEAGWGLVWSDRHGVETPISSLERRADSPRLSPDGSKIAFRTPAANCDVWVYDLARGTTTRVTQQGDNHGVAWSPDGSRIAVARVRAEGTDILSLPSDGTGNGQRLAEFGAAAGASGVIPLSWSKPAGVMLVEDRFGHETGLDILAIPVTGGKPEPVINTPFEDSSAVLSPDGRLIAYVSDETGRNEVYVRPFKGAGVRVQVSNEGGSEPVWDRQGKELFFRNERSFLVVEIRTGTGVEASRPRVLFTKSNEYPFTPLFTANYDVSLDGQRLLMMRGRQWAEGEVVIVLNWFNEWKAH